MGRKKIRRMLVIFSLSILCLGLFHCGTVASVRPLGRGKSSLTFSSGGPVAPVFDIKMPLPYTLLRYRRGLNESTDVHGGIHTTMLILGNLGMDVGITKHVVSQLGLRPALCVEASIYGFYHIGEFSSVRVYPALSLIGSYQLASQRHTVYFGTQTMMQFTSPYVVLAPLVGFEFSIGRKLLLNLETKWYAPSEESERRAVDYAIKPFNYGALGFVWGLSYRL
jgi:hypothetical protein